MTVADYYSAPKLVTKFDRLGTSHTNCSDYKQIFSWCDNTCLESMYL